MSVSVRAAEPGEGALLNALACATFGLACPPGTPPADIEEFVATQLSAERFERYLADPDRRLLVATSDAAFIGYAMLIAVAPTDSDVAAVVTARPAVELSKFYLLADAHGSGAAAELMRSAVETARLGGARTLWLGVNQQNGRANRFYEKSGFVIVGTKRFALGGRWEEDFVRERML
jgi:ribosomal protein S18 acetylase RimI-like enzyme